LLVDDAVVAVAADSLEPDGHLHFVRPPKYSQLTNVLLLEDVIFIHHRLNQDSRLETNLVLPIDRFNQGIRVVRQDPTIIRRLIIGDDGDKST